MTTIFHFLLSFPSVKMRINCRVPIVLQDQMKGDLFEKDELDINSDTNRICHHDH